MDATRRRRLVKTGVVLSGALLGGTAASAAAAVIVGVVGQRSAFYTEDTIPVAAFYGAIIGGALASMGWKSLRFAPLRWVLLIAASGATAGGIVGGVIGAALDGRGADVSGGFVGALAGFFAAVVILKRRYRASSTH